MVKSGPATPHPAGPGAAGDTIPTAALLAATLPDPFPCSCDGSVFWLDPLGKLHCIRCRVPPNQALVRGQARVRLDHEGAFCWSYDNPSIPPDAGPLEFQSADEPPCHQCGGLWFWWSLDGKKFCQWCQEKNFKGIFRRLEYAARLRDHHARDPDTARRRAANEIKRARLADERMRLDAAARVATAADDQG